MWLMNQGDFKLPKSVALLVALYETVVGDPARHVCYIHIETRNVCFLLTRCLSMCFRSSTSKPSAIKYKNGSTHPQA